MLNERIPEGLTLMLDGRIPELKQAKSRKGHREGKPQNPTWSYLSHHQDHYLSKPPGGGGGGLRGGCIPGPGPAAHPL